VISPSELHDILRLQDAKNRASHAFENTDLTSWEFIFAILYLETPPSFIGLL
jgi:hypothetical protein